MSTRAVTSVEIDSLVEDIEVPGALSGLDHIRNKRLNKGLAFTMSERQSLCIHGLLPPTVKNMDEQVMHTLLVIDRLENPLDKFVFLNHLSENNERLFYNVVAADVAKMMPLIYTPTVGLGCQKYSLIFQNPKGLFITIKDKGHVYNVLKNWPEPRVRAIVVTDGERILGLGDLGANGMGIPVGKLMLYTALAGIMPHLCLPITLDVGTNTGWILEDPIYIGLRQKRVSGPEYDEFIDEFMAAVVKRFGKSCLIQFEDFGNANAFRLLEKYRNSYCCFNDDIQGTAAVILAGILVAMKIKKTSLKDVKVLFYGAGEAALGIANLLSTSIQREGLSPDDAKKNIWLVDSKGLIVKNRPQGGLTKYKEVFAHDHAPVETLKEALDVVKPAILIGAAAIPGAFSPEVLEAMSALNETPVIFALSNPTTKSECTAEDAYKYTKGRCLFASGSPFNPVTFGDKVFHPGQGNNSYIFPGLALGIICAGLLTVPEELFIISAQRLANMCTQADMDSGCVYPPLQKITECSIEIATAVVEYAYTARIATFQEPADKRAFIKSQMYKLNYQPSVPERFDWK